MGTEPSHDGEAPIDLKRSGLALPTWTTKKRETTHLAVLEHDVSACGARWHLTPLVSVVIECLARWGKPFNIEEVNAAIGR